VENVKLKKLDNGITLITEKLPDISTFSMGFFVKTGAMNETKKECGISHFIEHLMFKGTKNRTAKEISEFVDFEGGILNAFTSREMTCYYIKLLSSKIDIAIDVLTDMLLNSNFDEESIEKERNVIDFRKAKKEEILDLSYEIKKGKKVIKKPSNQIHLCFTTRGVSSKSDLRYPAAIISNVLGEGMSSRLFQKIREERGLAYSVYTYLTRFENCGLLSVYVGTTKEDYKEVIKLIKEEFKNIKENGISERELRKAKNKYESAFTFSLESTGSRMNRLASMYVTYGKIISLDKVREDIEKVTLKDIKKAAEFLFDEQYYSQTIVGDI